MPPRCCRFSVDGLADDVPPPPPPSPPPLFPGSTFSPRREGPRLPSPSRSNKRVTYEFLAYRSVKDRLSAVAARSVLDMTTSLLVGRSRRCTGWGGDDPVGFPDKQQRLGTIGAGVRRIKGRTLRRSSLLSPTVISPSVLSTTATVLSLYTTRGGGGGVSPQPIAAGGGTHVPRGGMGIVPVGDLRSYDDNV